MHAIATAAITKSIESVIESWVSVSECRSHNKKYWEKRKHLKDKSGHFDRRSENIQDFSVSKVVDKMIEEPPKIPFLCPSCKAAKKSNFTDPASNHNN